MNSEVIKNDEPILSDKSFESDKSKNWNTNRQHREISHYRNNVLGIEESVVPR